MSDDKPSILLWFRKDLRLDDHAALTAAVASGHAVIPVYLNEGEDAAGSPLGAAQRWWLHHSLAALSTALEALGSRLVLRRGRAADVLPALAEETGAAGVYWSRLYDPHGFAADAALKAALRERDLDARSFAGQILHEPGRLKTTTGGSFRVYTPFWKALDGAGDPPEPMPAPDRLRPPARWPRSEALDTWRLPPTRPDWAAAFPDVWEPGEKGAQRRLADFIETGLKGYRERRDFPAEAHVSMLSPHLALGEISPARIWHATRGLSADYPREDIIHFRKELAWRDFSYHLLFHFPDLATRNWNGKFDGFPWRDAPDLFDRWRRGLTGYPIVDAGMRQLWRHGFMHNRVRMIAASFLIKDLMIDWRRGERWFRDTLVDADPASNAASWQWVAGSGADASPYFRVFNPILQGEKFDPDGAYVRRFVPELSGLDSRYVHRPFEAPRSELDAAGIRLGETYPKPIVDHKAAREGALAAYASLTGP